MRLLSRLLLTLAGGIAAPSSSTPMTRLMLLADTGRVGLFNTLAIRTEGVAPNIGLEGTFDTVEVNAGEVGEVTLCVTALRFPEAVGVPLKLCFNSNVGLPMSAIRMPTQLLCPLAEVALADCGRDFFSRAATRADITSVRAGACARSNAAASSP